MQDQTNDTVTKAKPTLPNRRFSLLRPDKRNGQITVSAGEGVLIELLREMIATESDDIAYANFEAWDMLKLSTNDILAGGVPSARDMDAAPLLYVAAYAAAEWIRSHRAKLSTAPELEQLEQTEEGVINR